MDNPCPGWLSDGAWDNITELDKLTNFHGIITAFEQYPRDWNVWYTRYEQWLLVHDRCSFLRLLKKMSSFQIITQRSNRDVYFMNFILKFEIAVFCQLRARDSSAARRVGQRMQ